MIRPPAHQGILISDILARFPSSRYQGSKIKLADWIWDQIAGLNFTTCLDAFGGTGSVAYRLKQAGKVITYNDLLKFNEYIGRALIENSQIRLMPEKIEWLLARHPHISYPRVVQDTFRNIYFTDEENLWIDQTLTNIRRLRDPYEFALAFFSLCQACLVKRPYNLFHRKNLYIRFANVPRSFGNKASWDKPFEEWFQIFVEEANRAVFDNGKRNIAVNYDALDVPGKYDLIYIDTPYISKQGIGVDYLSFYHFLEGMTIYEKWKTRIDYRSKHLRLKSNSPEWADKRRIRTAFDRLFARFHDSILVVSYRSDGTPSEAELISLLAKYKRDVRVEYFGRYKYVLSTNSESNEILFIGT